MRRCKGFLRSWFGAGAVLFAALVAVTCGCSLVGKSKPATADKNIEDQITLVNSLRQQFETETKTHFKLVEAGQARYENMLADLQRQVLLLSEKAGTTPPAAETTAKLEPPAFSPTTELPPDKKPVPATQPEPTTEPPATEPAATQPTPTQPTTEPATTEPPATEPANTQPAQPSTTPAMNETEKADAQLLRLRACKPEEVAGVAKDMRPVSKYVVKQLIEGLNDPDWDFRNRAERALEQLDPVVVMGDIIAILNNPRTRVQAVRIIGTMGTTTNEVVSQLRGYLGSTENVDLAFYSANSLALLHVKDGVPALIKYLRSDDEIRRLLAFHTLNKVAAQGFGYSFKAAPEVRENAVKQWEAWWEENKETLWE